MKIKGFKKSILMSALSMSMLASLAVGGTYAYFTDSVSIKDNVITAGSVDVNATLYEGTANTDPVVDKVEITNFAPGDNADYLLEVENVGSLVADYKIIVTATDETLFDALTITFGGDPLMLTDGVFQTDWKAIATGVTVKSAIAVTFNEGAGNTYQNTNFAFDIDVLATQENAPKSLDFIGVSNYVEEMKDSINAIATNLYNKEGTLGTQTNYSTYGNDPGLTPITSKLPNFDVDSLYVNMGKLNVEVSHLMINDKKYVENDLYNVVVSIGNANMLYMPAYRVVNDYLYISSMVLNMEKTLGNKILINDDIAILEKKTQDANSLTVNKVEVSSGTVTQVGNNFTVTATANSWPCIKIGFDELTSSGQMILSKTGEFDMGAYTLLYYGLTAPDNNAGNPEYWAYTVGAGVVGTSSLSKTIVIGDKSVVLNITTTIA